MLIISTRFSLVYVFVCFYFCYLLCKWKGKQILNFKLATNIDHNCTGEEGQNHDKNVHNLCVQNVMGRVGGEANLVNDNKCRVFRPEGSLEQALSVSQSVSQSGRVIFKTENLC